MINYIEFCVILIMVAISIIVFIAIVYTNKDIGYNIEYNIGDILSNENTDPNPFNNKPASYVRILDRELGSDGNWYYRYQYCDQSGNPNSELVFSGRLLYNKKVN